VTFLLDTNVVSEWSKARPNTGVITWLSDVDEDRVFISAVTLAELRYGIARLEDGGRRKRLDEWLRDDLPSRFEGRVLPIDGQVADIWGEVMAQREAQGRPMSVMDAFIAATAKVHELTLVTRNTSDFKSSLKAIINPWTEA
jgi:predicted nucleic acid-binding protein